MALPPRESCSNRVSRESRYAMFDPELREANCEMTLLRLARPVLMVMPSLILSPLKPVLFRRSLPARSTKFSLLSMVIRFSLDSCSEAPPDEVLRRCTRFKLNIACDLDDLEFAIVGSVCRIDDPKSSAFIISSTELTTTCFAPVIKIRPFVSSRMFTAVRSSCGTDPGTRRSRNCSL